MRGAGEVVEIPVGADAPAVAHAAEGVAVVSLEDGYGVGEAVVVHDAVAGAGDVVIPGHQVIGGADRAVGRRGAVVLGVVAGVVGGPEHTDHGAPAPVRAPRPAGPFRGAEHPRRGATDQATPTHLADGRPAQLRA